jgi:hypothetical protein
MTRRLSTYIEYLFLLALIIGVVLIIRTLGIWFGLWLYRVLGAILP